MKFPLITPFLGGSSQFYKGLIGPWDHKFPVRILRIGHVFHPFLTWPKSMAPIINWGGPGLNHLLCHHGGQSSKDAEMRGNTSFFRDPGNFRSLRVRTCPVLFLVIFWLARTICATRLTVRYINFLNSGAFFGQN